MVERSERFSLSIIPDSVADRCCPVPPPEPPELDPKIEDAMSPQSKGRCRPGVPHIFYQRLIEGTLVIRVLFDANELPPEA